MKKLFYRSLPYLAALLTVLLPLVSLAQAPTITSFTPTSGPAGTVVTINGTNFSSATSVLIGSSRVAQYQINSPTSITALIDASNGTDFIRITNPSGTGISTQAFTVTATPTTVTVSVTPPGPLTLCSGSTTLTATAVVEAFNPGNSGFNGRVRSVLALPDGKLLVGGDFTTYNGVDVPDYLVRLNTDGNWDQTFNQGGSGFGAFVYSLALEADGQVLVGGIFTAYNGNNATPDYLVRLNADGTRDASFNSGSSSLNSSVQAIAVTPNGQVLVGGSFTTYNGANTPDLLMRLNADGTWDSTFNFGGAGFSGGTNGNAPTVFSLALAPNGQILVGGGFSTYNGNGAVPDRLARLNANGTLDSNFNPGGAGFSGGSSGIVYTLALTPTGQVLVGGDFTGYNGDTAAPDLMLRLNADGSRDTNFNSGGSGFNNTVVQALALLSNGQVLVGGDFTTYNTTNVPDRLVRLNTNGTWDQTFNQGGSGFDGSVEALVVESTGKILVGGSFTTYNGPAPDRLVRLNANGTLDNADTVPPGVTYSWNTGAAGATLNVSSPGSYTATATVDGLAYNSNTVVVGSGGPAPTVSVNPPGPVTLPNGGGSQTLTATATVAAFNVGGGGFNLSVEAVLVQPDGKILVGGSFTSYNGNAATPDYLVRLNADGTRDASFNSGGSSFDAVVRTLALLSNGQVLVGGNFTTYNTTNVPDRLVRLNANGTLDPNFNSGGGGFNSQVETLAVTWSGQILVGGYFTGFNGNLNVPDGLLQLTANGTLDSNFNSGGAGFSGTFIPQVAALALTPSGQVLVGGNFTTYNGSATAPDGLIRLNTNGIWDQGFNSGGAGSSGGSNVVRTLAVTTGGQVLAGGSFTTYNGNTATPDGVIRLSSTGAPDTNFNQGGSGLADGYALALL